jgi:hypothetical protein
MKKFVSFLILFLLTIVSAEAAKQPRKFYLTQDAFTGSQALNACADDYHMAALFEIFDTSNLKYDTSLGLAFDDSGSGPPSNVAGWIRTGSPSQGTTGLPGEDNCFAWTSNSSSDKGTTARLTSGWSDAPSSKVNPWEGGVIFCDFPRRVWCMED